MGRVLGAFAVVLFCAGCGGPGAVTQPSSTTPAPMPSAHAEVIRPTAPTSVAPKSCTPAPSGTVRALPHR